MTHSSPQQTEEHARSLAAGDQRFLSDLMRTTAASQQRAAGLMPLAAGAIPPPACLVWASVQMVDQVRQMLLQRLKGEQQQQQRPPLTSEPWYEGALQLARLVSAGGSAAPSPPRTEAELLRTFADLQPPAAEAAQQPQPQQPVGGASAVAAPHFVAWEELMALPQLPQLLAAVADRNPALETVLQLAGLMPAAAEAGPGPSSAAAAAAVAAGKAAGGRPKAGAWLLPQLRAAAATARQRALREAGLLTAEGEVPLGADAALTALAHGLAPPPSPTAAAAAAACEWLAAVTLLSRAELALGCAGAGALGGASGVRQDVVAALQLLGLPLEPPELPQIEDLQVSEQDVETWVWQTASQLRAAGPGAGAASATSSAVRTPAALESRLLAARNRLGADGRALALAAAAVAAEAAGSAAQADAAGELPPQAAAAATWLRTVGAPLVSGLLSGGYDSLARLRGMVPELKEAVLFKLLESRRLSGGVAALTAAMYSDAEAAWRRVRVDAGGGAEATELLRREALAAELDLVHERFVPLPATPPPPAPLPSDAELATAVSALPPHLRPLYAGHYALRPDAGALPAVEGEAARQKVLERLAAADDALAGAVGGDLQAWLAEARKGLLKLEPPLLSLLLRFVKVRVSITPEQAEAQRTKLTALMALVAEQQRRAVEAGATAAGAGEVAGGRVAAAATAAGREVLAGGSGPVSAALASLLGAEGAQDFASWMEALALHSSPNLPTHTLLAQQSTPMDVERYLTMTHDPRLDLPASGLGASSRPTSTRWTDPALRRSEGEWLDEMQPQLNAYLTAMGLRPLGPSEWHVYKEAALAEWAAGAEQRQQRAQAAGESGFWNPRADEVYLQQLLERNIAPDDPLGPQSRRYLDTLLRNPSWTFAQRRRAVQRLIQLNTYFASQPPPPEEGSPFAPLFAVGGPDPVPQLPPLGAAAEAAGGTAPPPPGRAAGKGTARGRVGAGGAEALQLPDGF